MTYYCKNCNNIVGKWNNKYKCYDVLNFCKCTESKNNNSIYFLDCIYCDKFVGIKCRYVCENCFGENKIIGEENLFNWFLKYKKIVPEYLSICKICNEKIFRSQHWLFEELTFYKK